MTDYLVCPQNLGRLPWPDVVRELLASLIGETEDRLKNEADARAEVQEARDEYDRDRKEADRREKMGHAVVWPTPPEIRPPDTWRAWERLNYEIGDFLWERRHQLYDDAIGHVGRVTLAWRGRFVAAIAGESLGAATAPDFGELHRHLFVAKVCSQLSRGSDFRCSFEVVGSLDVEILDVESLESAVSGRWLPPPKPMVDL